MAEQRANPFAGLDRALLRSTQPQPTPEPASQPAVEPTQPRKSQARAPATKAALKQPRNHDTTVPRNDNQRSTDLSDVVERVRRAVKQLGKEAATYRFTADEKRDLAEIVYQYRGKGIRTSENEITRVAINYLIENYKTQGEQSVLALVLQRLND